MKKLKDILNGIKLEKKKILWSVLGFGVVLFVVLGYLLFNHIVNGLPSLEQLENPKQSLATNVFSVDGEMIGQFFKQNRMEIDLDSIPETFIQALIATEDRDFYDHWGVDLERFVKAMIKNITMFRREGASTITQQLSKNLYEFWVADETIFDTLIRKVREWITAIQIEQNYTKDEILEMYLNVSYFGYGAYGIEMASNVYFNEKVNNLTIPQSALLVALLKSSVVYDPVRRYNNAVQRRNLVMKNMVDVGYLNDEEYQELKLEPIEVKIEKSTERFFSNVAPHFVEYVRQKLEALSTKYDFNLYEDGLTVYTTLDTRYQRIASRVVEEHVEDFQSQFDKYWKWDKNREILDDLIDKAIKNKPSYKNAKGSEAKSEIYERLKNNVAFVDSVQRIGQQIEVGFVVLDATDGSIRSMVGARDQSFRYGLNHATQIKRQPGSSFKPIIYTVAISNGLYPAFPVLNQEFDYNGWRPRNFDLSTSGFLTLREGIKNSVNLISARLIIEDHVQLWKVGITASKMGIKSKLDLVPSISLGTSEVTPIELTSAYATLANRGIANDPMAILRIEDKDGILIESFTPNSREAISEETAYIITDMMRTVIDEGTGRAARSTYGFHRPAAGKTGTTQDYADAWFVGFTPQLAAGVWIGFDDRRVTFTGKYGQGAKAALPIWGKFMKEVYDSLKLPLAYFEAPRSENVVMVDFCDETIHKLGNPKLVSPDCRGGVLRDIINISDIPGTYNAERDTLVNFFDRYFVGDSLDHEAIEIIDESL